MFISAKPEQLKHTQELFETQWSLSFQSLLLLPELPHLSQQIHKCHQNLQSTDL